MLYTVDDTTGCIAARLWQLEGVLNTTTLKILGCNVSVQSVEKPVQPGDHCLLHRSDKPNTMILIKILYTFFYELFVRHDTRAQA